MASLMSGPSSAMGPASSPPWASLCSANGGQSHHHFLGATISVLYCVQRCPGTFAPECTPPVMHISSRRRPRFTAIVTLLAPSISVPDHVQRGTGMSTPECTCPGDACRQQGKAIYLPASLNNMSPKASQHACREIQRCPVNSVHTSCDAY